MAFARDAGLRRDEAAWSARVGKWRKAVGGSEAAVSPGFACILFARGRAPATLNQVLRGPDAAGRTDFFCGPRAGLFDGADLEPLPPLGPEGLAARSGLYADGMETTVAASHDSARGVLTLKTDLLNSTYVYRLDAGGCLLLSNSPLALAPFLPSPELDAPSMAEFLATGSLFGNRSLVKGITTLRPSRFHAWTAEGTESSCEYWRIGELPFDTLSLREGAARILGHMDADFARLKASGKPMVFDLTGGFDSRCNAGLALRSGLAFRATVTGAPGDEDARIAALIADRFGIRLDRVDPPPLSLARDAALLDAAGECSDFEYDMVEYARIMDIHERFFGAGEISVHGGAADVMRNYFLLRGFYAPDPAGELRLDSLVAKKFTPTIDPARLFRPGLLAGWGSHMRGRIAEYDLPGLPAFARLDNIYLRIRMQFWQGRIASSTTRLHGSFTPWINVGALSAILSTRWSEKHRGLLSREILANLPRGLASIPLTGGGVPGTGPLAWPRALPNLASHYGGKVIRKLRGKLGLAPRSANPLREELRAAVVSRRSELEGTLDPALVLKECGPGGALSENHAALCRLYTLIRAREHLAGLPAVL